LDAVTAQARSVVPTLRKARRVSSLSYYGADKNLKVGQSQFRQEPEGRGAPRCVGDASEFKGLGHPPIGREEQGLVSIG
jgi:hypothetical protein